MARHPTSEPDWHITCTPMRMPSARNAGTNDGRSRSAPGWTELDALLAEGVVVLDRAGEITMASSAATEIFQRADLVGRRFDDLDFDCCSADESPLATQAHPVSLALAGDPSCTQAVVVGVLRPTGERRWLSVRAVAQNSGATAVFVDMTAARRQSSERRAAVLRARQAEQRAELLDHVINALDVALAATDADGETTWVSPAAQRRLGVHDRIEPGYDHDLLVRPLPGGGHAHLIDALPDAPRARETSLRPVGNLPPEPKTVPVKPPQKHVRRVHSEGPSARPPTATVVFVDDEPLIAKRAPSMLARFGLSCEAFSDGLAALEYLQANPTTCQVLVSDVHLPGLAGPELLRRARAQKENLPVILLSGDINALQREGSPNTHFIAKPFRFRELADLILAVLVTQSAAAATT